jgi:hypothetical protein
MGIGNSIGTISSWLLKSATPVAGAINNSKDVFIFWLHLLLVLLLSVLVEAAHQRKLEYVLFMNSTVSPNIVFNFRVYKIKTVPTVRPLMVFRFVYFVVL